MRDDGRSESLVGEAMTLELTDLERAAMEMMLEGESSVLEALRRQWTHATISRRELTGCGFFTYLAVARAVSEPTMPRRLVISGPHGEIPGLAHGVGFVLFVEEGYLSFLEGFSYDEPWWPAPHSEFQLS
jgi:hypothetical protein